MQLRYLGDWHDYLKFALLRHIQAALDVTVGVNWYLSDPENNGDGQQRHHITSDQWACLDRPLLDKLKPFQAQEHRTLDNFERSGILRSDTCYYRRKVEGKDRRQNWHDQAISELSQADLIFLDPDNGFEVDSISAATQAKYALYDEALKYSALGKFVVGIQFARQCNPVERAEKVRNRLTQSVIHSANIPVVRCRVSPNVLFLFLSPKDRVAELSKTLESFEMKSPILKKDHKRILLIR